MCCNMCIGVLVGNKVDLTQRRVIKGEQGRAFAEAKGLKYFECSAVSYINY